MHKYCVVERWPEERQLALRCSVGHYHLTRALGVLPAVDARLEGAKPHLGFGVLKCPVSGAMFRVIFESIGNSQRPLAPNDIPGTRHSP